MSYLCVSIFFVVLVELAVIILFKYEFDIPTEQCHSN